MSRTERQAYLNDEDNDGVLGVVVGRVCSLEDATLVDSAGPIGRSRRSCADDTRHGCDGMTRGWGEKDMDGGSGCGGRRKVQEEEEGDQADESRRGVAGLM